MSGSNVNLSNKINKKYIMIILFTISGLLFLIAFLLKSNDGGSNASQVAYPYKAQKSDRFHGFSADELAKSESSINVRNAPVSIIHIGSDGFIIPILHFLFSSPIIKNCIDSFVRYDRVLLAVREILREYFSEKHQRDKSSIYIGDVFHLFLSKIKFDRSQREHNFPQEFLMKLIENSSDESFRNIFLNRICDLVICKTCESRGEKKYSRLKNKYESFSLSIDILDDNGEFLVEYDDDVLKCITDKYVTIDKLKYPMCEHVESGDVKKELTVIKSFGDIILIKINRNIGDDGVDPDLIDIKINEELIFNNCTYVIRGYLKYYEDEGNSIFDTIVKYGDFWYLCSGEFVIKVNYNVLVTDKAIILMYERK